MPNSPLIRATTHALPRLRGLEWQPLSGGKTNRLWRVGDAVVKSYPPDRATPLFPNDPLAEARALRLLHPLGLAPECLASAADWIIYAYVDGATWQSGAAPPAQLLGRLHAIDIQGHSFRVLPSGRAALESQTRGLCDLAGIAVEGINDGDVPPCAPRLLHGDAVAGNIIVSNTGLQLIDWQCPALGDPAEDLAAFLSPAMQTIYRGNPLGKAEEQEFLAAYPDRGIVARYLVLRPLFHLRMLAHCIWRAKRGDAGYDLAARAEKARL